MKKNKHEYAFHGDPKAFDKFRKDLFRVRPLESAERGKALQLAWRVFCKFESPDYALEGTEEFKKCLNDETYLAGIRYYGAFYKGELNHFYIGNKIYNQEKYDELLKLRSEIENPGYFPKYRG